MTVKPKTILIIAGPNGAGKSTFAREYLPEELGVGNFINADLIAAGLSPFSPERAAFQAGRIMLEEMKRLSANNESFGFETTLSGRTYLKDIENWRRAGYNVIRRSRRSCRCGRAPVLFRLEKLPESL